MSRSKYLKQVGMLTAYIAISGCIKAPPANHAKPFKVNELNACLAIAVDMSGSFRDRWNGEAHTLFLELMDQFFINAQGGESRVVLCQLSGNDNVVLSEGSPTDFRTRFRTPEDLNTFLLEHSDPGGSPVYRATDRAISYVSSIPGISKNTRLMAVILSDLEESAAYGETRNAAGRQMLGTLKKYQQMGGGLALYFVSQEEQARWLKICKAAGFKPGTYTIENTLVTRPQLPQFD